MPSSATLVNIRRRKAHAKAKRLEDMRDTLNQFTNTMGARFDALDRRLEERDKQFAANFLDIKPD
jgi:hypothetical protein